MHHTTVALALFVRALFRLTMSPCLLIKGLFKSCACVRADALGDCANVFLQHCADIAKPPAPPPQPPPQPPPPQTNLRQSVGGLQIAVRPSKSIIFNSLMLQHILLNQMHNLPRGHKL